MNHVILNYDQVTWTTPERAPPTTSPHQRESVRALDKFNVHRYHTRRVFSSTGLELVTRPATIRYLNHSSTAAACLCSNLLQLVWCGSCYEFVQTALTESILASQRISQDCLRLSGYGHELVAGVLWARALFSLKTRRVYEAIPPADVVVRKKGSISGVLLVTRPRLKITRFVMNSPFVAL
ncbi:uncharacterized protein TNCV_3264461 [Trichonephila clavipes]|nr:uncharacterized protein TNCV_3264461 [Trichonephila clavipes]